MKKALIIVSLFFGIASVSHAARSVRVRGSTNRKTGTYKAPHQRTAPNRTKTDNYSTKGNVNPYTGKEGTTDPYK